MKFTTTTGETYDVDLKARTCQLSDGKGFPFHELTGVYVGSVSVRFRDLAGRHILHVTDSVVSVEGSPLEVVTAEEGNVLILTKNSVYEINQEQKLIRKLAGFNPSRSHVPQGDWSPYTRIEGFAVGQMGLIYYADQPESRPFITTHVREIRGTLVENPQPGVLAVTVALVQQATPSL